MCSKGQAATLLADKPPAGRRADKPRAGSVPTSEGASPKRAGKLPIGSLPNAAHPAFDVAEIGELPAADSGLATPVHMRLPA